MTELIIKMKKLINIQNKSKAKQQDLAEIFK